MSDPQSDDGNDPQRAISERAYAIWLEEGQPEGRQKEHWGRAVQELGLDASPDEDSRLEEGLEGSFPTSDPVSEAQPGGGITGPGDR